ncbi:hypothetical protein [Noviherbaspirillum saxi]|uniref:Uncharacterized protein n=1 Tax=Noviherbaspirillum saxi TaxID=2320863 RepID=A0A3A3FL81_9BURK|nr:hypothetical protein [Noviherbaspirillum saxi]RJF95215.1 hypothetical protein D3871_17340 [Noviherbaspirillum saxi]
MDISHLPGQLRGKLGRSIGRSATPTYAGFLDWYFLIQVICKRSEIYVHAQSLHRTKSQFFRFFSIPIWINEKGERYTPSGWVKQQAWSHIPDFDLGNSTSDTRAPWQSGWKVLKAYGSRDFDYRYAIGLQSYWYEHGGEGTDYRYESVQQDFEDGYVTIVKCFAHGETQPSAEITLASVSDNITPEHAPDPLIKEFVTRLPADIRTGLGPYMDACRHGNVHRK